MSNGVDEFKKHCDQLELLIKEKRMAEARLVSIKMGEFMFQLMKGYGHRSETSKEVEIKEMADNYLKNAIERAKD